ncbi:HlyD family efflux transporter periplasmic adaptor subunit [Permianibacter sp. IMCC34836]|uniref:efflux RND transporter periplasmic adaptor subunit n=1 Tax=Permianibacter fluminis TaxID=2738515 RepID=UPI001556CC2D|nr:HlyD family efflux transporter periplasmic adaptor subunit [Permianibacter fluminis]NQD36964.1 HlyD family efflux transporter periplasmic adaptor subunit [Permianibacter fluminis]
MTNKLFLAAWLAIGLLSGASFGHGGEDHADEKATPTNPLITGSGSRASLQGEYAEAVLVAQPEQLTLWLDEADSNAPLQAELQLQIDGTVFDLHSDTIGVYQTTLASPLTAGPHPVVLSMIAGDQSELLSGTLQIGASEAPDSTHSWSPWWWLLTVPVIALLVFTLRRRSAQKPQRFDRPHEQHAQERQQQRERADSDNQHGNRNLLIILVAVLVSMPLQRAFGHGGEDHADEKPASIAVNGDAPKRLPDGSLFVPKSAQRLLNVRTERVQVADHAVSLRLNGQVIADPNGSGLVQAPQAGRVLPVQNRLPALGSKVRAGETLALLEPVISQSERANLTGELARVDAALTAASQRLERLNGIRDSVPRRDYEQASVDVAGLRAQQQALRDSLQAKLPLRAPIAGVISDTSVVAGSQVEAGHTVFEIVSSNARVIEAAAYDDRYLQTVQSAVFLHDGRQYPLRLLGIGRKLRDQAMPVQFQMQNSSGVSSGELAIGTIGTVLVASAEQHRGASVPQSALLRGDDGRAQVLIKIAPEQFRLLTVSSEPLPDNRALISSGLAGGERVVISNASLLQQIR